MSVRRSCFGRLKNCGSIVGRRMSADGEEPYVLSSDDQQIVHKYDISNASGSLKVSVTEYGATLLSVQTPNRLGELEEITLNHYDNLVALANQESKPYLGCIAGRYANRIAKGTFSLDGITYHLATNNGVNHLHGGVAGFDTKIWQSEVLDEATTGRIGVRFSLFSPHMDEGYPGDVQVVVEYEVTNHNELLVHILANTNAPTILNLTNHAYWNLSGDVRTSVHNHLLHLACSRYLPVDATQIPTGQLAPVTENAAFDFWSTNAPKALSEELLMSIDGGGGSRGLDHCFVVDGYEQEEEKEEDEDNLADETGEKKSKKNKKLLDVATLIDPVSGRVLVLRSTQPGVQVYTANWLPEKQNQQTIKKIMDRKKNVSEEGGGEVDVEDSDITRLPDDCFFTHAAVCLETQHFPDAPNHPHFPSTVIRPKHPKLTPATTTTTAADAASAAVDTNTAQGSVVEAVKGDDHFPAVPTQDEHDYYELSVFKFHVLP